MLAKHVYAPSAAVYNAILRYITHLKYQHISTLASPIRMRGSAPSALSRAVLFRHA